MPEKEQEKRKDKQLLSPLAKEPTYGERMYQLMFHSILNFWVNLFVSAAFTFWVAHSRNPIGGQCGPVPRDIQTKFGNWLEKRFFMQSIRDPITRMERAQSMSVSLTLLTPGHFILIPSVWLGPKIKTSFVKFFDRRHYGEEAMDDPALQHRYALIEQETRPTLFGAVVGRAGSVLATQVVARTVGTPNNWANIIGRRFHIGPLERFGGTDPLAEGIGEMVGNDIERIAPKTTGTINEYFRGKNFDWSNTQIRNPQFNSSGPYNKTVQNFTRYVGQDVLATLITSVTVHPIINMLKNFVPGLTYTPKVAHPLPKEERKGMKIRSNPIAQETAPEPPHTNEPQPGSRVASVENLSRMAAAPTHQKTGA